MAGPKEDANVADLAWLTERKLARTFLNGRFAHLKRFDN